MAGSIGLGLVLNVLFWTLSVLAATGLASLAAIEYFPGREERKGTAERRASRGGRTAERPREAQRPGEEDEDIERYRKAS